MTPLLKAAEVAARLGCTPATVLKLAREGDIEHVGVGRLVRFHEAQVAAFIESSTARGRERRKHGGKAKKRQSNPVGNANRR